MLAACAAIPTPIALVVIIGGGLHTNIEAETSSRQKRTDRGRPNSCGPPRAISIDDIGKYGLAGGPNSEINKIGRFFSKRVRMVDNSGRPQLAGPFLVTRL